MHSRRRLRTHKLNRPTLHGGDRRPTRRRPHRPRWPATVAPVAAPRLPRPIGLHPSQPKRASYRHPKKMKMLLSIARNAPETVRAERLRCRTAARWCCARRPPASATRTGGAPDGHAQAWDAVEEITDAPFRLSPRPDGSGRKLGTGCEKVWASMDSPSVIIRCSHESPSSPTHIGAVSFAVARSGS